MPGMRRARTWASAERSPGARAASPVRRLPTSGEPGASGSAGASSARAARDEGSTLLALRDAAVLYRVPQRVLAHQQWGITLLP
jgi:hypothetical protein